MTHFLKGLLWWVFFCYYTTLLVRCGGHTWKHFTQHPYRKEPLPSFFLHPISFASFLTDVLLGGVVICVTSATIALVVYVIDYLQLRNICADSDQDGVEPMGVMEQLVVHLLMGMSPLDVIEQEVLRDMERSQAQQQRANRQDIHAGEVEALADDERAKKNRN